MNLSKNFKKYCIVVSALVVGLLLWNVCLSVCLAKFWSNFLELGRLVELHTEGISIMHDGLLTILDLL